MPYPTNASLPPAVRNKIKSSRRRRQWRHVWNSEYARHGDEGRAFASAWSVAQKGATVVNEDFNFFLPITKIDRERRLISGYASTPALDLDGEIVSLDAVKKALPGYWQWRNIRRMHTADAVGVAKEANVDDKGLFLTAKIVDDDCWGKVLEGVYKGYSIGGKKLAKTGNTITEIELVEVSVVDRPANPECRFDVHKSSGEAPAFLAKLPKKFLKKAGPPAAHDGFSLPAKIDKTDVADDSGAESGDEDIPCAEHGVKGCKECLDKRDVSEKERKRLAGEGEALPDGSFPIANVGDLNNARQAVGRAKNPSAARAHIKRRAAALGVKLPSNWNKKLAKSLIAEAKKESKFFKRTDELKKSRGRELAAVIGQKAERKSMALDFIGADDQDFLNLGGQEMSAKAERIDEGLNFNTDDVVDPLAKAVLDMVKRASVPTRAARMGMARGDLKKARKAAKDMEDCIKAAHGELRSRYLAKQAMIKAGKKPNDNDADDDMATIGKVMSSLNKAFGSSSTLKTFIKSANVQLKKAMSRSGQRGQEVSDGNEDYQVPVGVKDLSPGDLDTAGGSSPPFVHGMETPFPGKSAKTARGMISASEANALARAAAAEAQVEILSKLPSAPVFGKKPVLADMAKIVGGTQDEAVSIMKGVDPADLTKDETSNARAVSRMIGNMIIGGHGKSVMDDSFRGMGGLT